MIPHSTEMYTSQCVRELASGKLLRSTACAQAGALWQPGEVRWEGDTTYGWFASLYMETIATLQSSYTPIKKEM